MRKLNIAILGTGSIASGGHAPALLQTESAQLWSVLSRDISRASNFAQQFKAQGRIPAYTSLEALLKDPELDAVIIATPDKLHTEQVIVAAEAGKHILLEKPLATDAEGAHAILRNCKRFNVTLGMCYRLRWHAGHRAVVQAVHSGAIGSIRHVRTLWTWQQSDASNWRASSEVGRWWSLGSMGTHLIDLARWIILPSGGEIVETKSVITTKCLNSSHDETAIGSFKFENGATADLCTSVLFNAPSRLEIYGSTGWIVCEDTFGREAAGRIVTNSGYLSFPVVNPFVGLINDFVSSVRDKREPEVGVAEGVRNVELLLALA